MTLSVTVVVHPGARLLPFPAFQDGWEAAAPTLASDACITMLVNDLSWMIPLRVGHDALLRIEVHADAVVTCGIASARVVTTSLAPRRDSLLSRSLLVR